MNLLRTQNLSWAPKKDGPPLFENLQLTIEPGELVIIQGASGSGKSTLFRCLTLLEPVRSGEVFWHGERVTADNIRRFRNRVVLVQQRPVSIAETVGADLQFGQKVTHELVDDRVKPLSDAEQDAYLARLGLQELSRDRRFDDLSGGEQQRVALVRSLTTRPDVLLLDEPTASLDPQNVIRVEELLLEYLAEKPAERALVWISHHASQLERLQGRILSMEELKKP